MVKMMANSGKVCAVGLMVFGVSSSANTWLNAAILMTSHTHTHTHTHLQRLQRSMCKYSMEKGRGGLQSLRQALLSGDR